jgi:hypothetical protein
MGGDYGGKFSLNKNLGEKIAPECKISEASSSPKNFNFSLNFLSQLPQQYCWQDTFLANTVNNSVLTPYRLVLYVHHNVTAYMCDNT